MSEEHKQRKQDIFKFALPPKETKKYEKIIQTLDEHNKKNPGFEKYVKETYEKAVALVEIQNDNGAGLPMDKEIRHFLREFNSRNFEHGLTSMPTSFNIIEGFFNYKPELQSFELLPEENNLLSLYDFIDFITSPEFTEDPKTIKDNLEENIIYHYDISSDLENLTFTTEDGNNYVIGGVSMVRRGNEVNIFLLTGLVADIEQENDKMIDIREEYHTIPGKENIKPDPDLKLEAVKLFNKPNYWKTLSYCRIDIEKFTIDSRYIQKDIGIAYTTITDDISGMLNYKGEFLTPTLEETFKKMNEDIISYAPLFEFATKCLYLPIYFNHFEEQITDEEHPTNLAKKKEKKILFRRDKKVPLEYKIKNRTVWCLNRDIKTKSDIVYFGENEFKIERSGYWKAIEYNTIGKDKNGKPIHNKTWVESTLAWYEDNNQTLTVSTNASSNSISANEGFIYIMRNASHALDIFKIGLTTRDSKTRAKELSATTGSVDKFLVANEWKVKDCVLAEKLIHKRLDKFRLNNSREFFKIEYKVVLDTVIQIINDINA